MIHLTFLNRQFDIGGAERQLIELLKHIDKSRFCITMITFYGDGPVQSEVEAIAGIHLVSLGKRGKYDILSFLWRLSHTVRASQPRIIHGYLDLANVLALFVGRLSGAKVVWGIRASNMDFDQYGWSYRLSLYLQDLLGRFADLIIVNSYAGQEHYQQHGFPPSKMVVISNGIDTQRFQADTKARRQIRTEWKIGDDEKLISLVGRLDPMKDHPTFLNAAALLIQEMPKLRFVCVGDGPTHYREELQRIAQDLGLTGKVVWAGSRNDMAAVYNALDIATSSSQWGEGFPNVIGEAMACEVPCVVTNVGDSAMLVGDTGIVVPPRDPRALADGWKSIFEKSDLAASLGAAARKRIVNEFSVDKLAERTAEVLAALITD